MADKKIGDRYWRAGNALATDAIRLQVRIVKLLGPAADSLQSIFAPLMVALPSESTAAATIAMASDAAAIKAIGDIAARIEPDAFVELIEDICKLGLVSYDAKSDKWDPILIDMEFVGANARDLYPVVFFILKETLQDFFSGVLASGRPQTPARR